MEVIPMTKMVFFECPTEQSMEVGLQQFAPDAQLDGIKAVQLSLLPCEDGSWVNGTIWVAVHYKGVFRCALAELSAPITNPRHVSTVFTPFTVVILQGDPEVSFIRCEIDWAMSSDDLLAVRVTVPGYSLLTPLSRLRK
jgi:hypothetical protein